MVSDLSRSASCCINDKILEDKTIIDDIDVIKVAIEENGLEQVTIFDIEDLTKQSFPDSDMQILLSDPYAIVPSQSESLSISEDKSKDKIMQDQERKKAYEEKIWQHNFLLLR